MPIQKIEYTDALELTFDANEIELVNGSAVLKLQPPVAQNLDQDFSSSAGITYDNNKTVIEGGLLKQADNAALAGANYSVDQNLSWGVGTLTASNFTGSYDGVNDRLDLTGGGLDYNAVGKINAQNGTVIFKYTPGYDGAPPPGGSPVMCNYQRNLSVNNNRLTLYHASTSGNLSITAYQSNGLGIFSFTTIASSWLPNIDQEYEIVFEWDFLNANGIKVYIDNTLMGTLSSTATRTAGTSDVTVLQFAKQGVAVSDGFYMTDLLVYDTLEYSGAYTPGYTVGDDEYNSDLITLPSVSTAAGTASYTTFTITDPIGTFSYIVNGLYWDTVSWVASDGSIAQSNTEAEVNTNISTLPSSQTITVQIRTLSSSTQGSISNLNLGYTAGVYLTTDPSITNITSINTDLLLSFSNAQTTSNDTSIGHIIVVDGVDMYWDTVNWVVSDGTFLQSNNSSDISLNAGSLTLATEGDDILIKTLLHAEFDSDTPSISLVTLEYSFAPGAPVVGDLTKVFGYLCDPDTGAREGITVTFNPPKSIKGGSCLVAKNVSGSVVTDVDGYFEYDILPGVYSVSVGKTVDRVITIPEITSINLNELIP